MDSCVYVQSIVYSTNMYLLHYAKGGLPATGGLYSSELGPASFQASVQVELEGSCYNNDEFKSRA